MKPRINYYLHDGVGYTFNSYSKFDKNLDYGILIKSGNTYIGISRFLFGISKIKGEQLTEWNIELVNFVSNYEISRITWAYFPSREYTSLSLDYFKSFYHIGNRNKMFLGVNTGINATQNYLRNLIVPLSDSEIFCYCLHGGIKVNYQFLLNKYWRIGLSSSIILLDAGYYYEKYLDSNLPKKAQFVPRGINVDFLRNQYQFTLEIGYRIK